ncbi:prepilin-type N-terminal cleavage/methylation domain-containing protein [Lentisphaera profundi]|uniref:Prepilin-type N-terminal cleavage/methylation domain-containing protein n=1 Tax=Lentisphaera profundi TaxID=1658616 RepID=A0ABY7VXT3_9BACT|nr:prepilin-type N-terminal cleavage/methylation domain-containing protein [Lentisphaera profundi]WDE97677.1 prepilin-type N-terminal cleavage/methylation domain-containing protein [Lentisphaera profundi]
MLNKSFTLIEVIIATVILSMASLIAVQILSRSAQLSFEAESTWGTSHLLSLGAEYHLLWGAEAEFPQELLPQGIAIECHTTEYVDDSMLEEDSLELNSTWQAMNIHVELWRDGELIDELVITKLLREQDL